MTDQHRLQQIGYKVLATAIRTSPLLNDSMLSAAIRTPPLLNDSCYAREWDPEATILSMDKCPFGGLGPFPLHTHPL